MSSPIATIDPLVLAAVTGGSKSSNSSSSSSIDGLLNQLSSLTSSIKDIKTKTSGLSSTEMMMLCVLAAQNRGASSSVVYVSGGRRIGCW
jgi:hypothetical protein